MGVMCFSSSAIPQVEEFIKKHYKGGTVLDFGCGSGRYAHCFPKDKYLGVDGENNNVNNVIKLGYKAEYHNLEEWEPEKVFDYVFSSVVFDQTWQRPYGWGKKLILIEPEFYIDEIDPDVCEIVDCSRTTRMMTKW